MTAVGLPVLSCPECGVVYVIRYNLLEPSWIYMSGCRHKVTARSLDAGEIEYAPITGAQVIDDNDRDRALELLAAVSESAPARRGKYTYSAGIRWALVDDVRTFLAERASS